MELTMDLEIVTVSKKGFDNFIKPQLYSDVTVEHNFTDVTLVCDGDKQLKAHKVILGSCSKFFKNVFLRNPHTHPIIYMKGIEFGILEAVTKFLYLGEAEVEKVKVEDILYVMKDLEIDGFEEIRNRQDNIGQGNYVPSDVAIEQKSSEEDLSLPNTTTETETAIQDNSNDVVTTVESIDECIFADETLITKQTHDDIIDCEEAANVSVESDHSTATLELSEEYGDTMEEVLADKMEEVDKSVECVKVVEEESEILKNIDSESEVIENPSKKICLRIKNVEEMIVTSDTDNQNEVTEQDVKTPTTIFYKCEQCDFNGSGRAVLKKHIQDKHGFPCDLCNYIATSRGNFWKHKRSIH